MLLRHDSFPAQRDDGIHARRAPGRDVARQERHRQHHGRHSGERDQVEPLDAEQQRLDVPREGHCRERAADHAEQSDLPALPDEHPADGRSRSAPSAMRTPISRVRCVTPYDSTPYRPTAPRTSASTAAVLTMSIVNERLAIAFAARRFIVKMRYIGDVRNTSRMTARTSGSSSSARDDLMTYAGDPDTPAGTPSARRLAAEVVDQDVLDDADDGVPLVGVGGRPDLFADRILAGEQDAGRRLADDHVG